MTETELREKIIVTVTRYDSWQPRAIANELMAIVAPLLEDSERLASQLEEVVAWVEQGSLSSFDAPYYRSLAALGRPRGLLEARAAEQPAEQPDAV